MRKKILLVILPALILSGCANQIIRENGTVIEEADPVNSESASSGLTEEEVPKHSPDDPIEGCYQAVADADLSNFMVQIDDMVFAPGVTTMNHALDKIDMDGRYTYSVLLDSTNRWIEAITIYKNETLYVVVHNAETTNGNVVGKINPSKEAKKNCWISGGYCLDGSNVGEPGTLPLDSFAVSNGTGAEVVLLPTYNGSECVDLAYKFLE